MSVKTIKEFEKELRKKLLMSLKLKEKPILISERVLFASECQLWDKIRTGGYSWVDNE